MSEEFSKQIRSKATSDGNIELSIAKVEKPVPGDDEVLIEVKHPQLIHQILVFY